MLNELVFNSSYFLSYEIVLNKRISLELELGFDNAKRFFPYFSTANSIPTISRSDFFEQRHFKPAITGKYYFLFTKHGNGAFLGVDVRLDYLTFLEEDFSKNWEALNNRPVPY